MTNDLWSTLDAAGKAENVDPRLLYSVGMRESLLGKNTGLSIPGDPDSPRGFFQMRPSTAQAILGHQPQNLQEQALAAAKYLSQGLDATGSVEGATAYYHGGPDQSIWGPKTADYSHGVTQTYTQLASAKKPGATMTDASNDPDVAAGMAALAPMQKSATPAQGQSANNGLPDVVQQKLNQLRQQGYGATPAAQPAATASTQPAAGLSAQPGDDPDLAAGQAILSQVTKAVPISSTTAPTQTINDYNFSDGGNNAIADYVKSQPPVDPNVPAGQRAMDAVKEVGTGLVNSAKAIGNSVGNAIPDVNVDPTSLAAAPNTTYGSILPVARDNATGALRFALPSSLRDLAQGAYDLVQGPSTGTVTPAATGALAQLAMGGALSPSVAAGTGVAIGGRLLAPGSSALGRSEVPDLLGGQFRANPTAGAAAGKLAPPTSPVSPAAPATPTQAANDVAALTGNAQPSAPPKSNLPIITAAQADARVSQLLDHFGQGGPTDVQPSLVPGAPRTLAQATGNAGYAALENGLRGTDPFFNNLYQNTAASRISASKAAFENIAGTPADIAAAETARDVTTTQARNAAFIGKQPVDAQPVIDTINNILSSPDGKRSAVVSSLTPYLDKLQTSDGGALESDPEMLYGVRKAINDSLASKGTDEGAAAQTAKRQLIAVRNSLDSTIESGAPGFADYIKQYSDASQPIDAMRWLQSQNITDQLGNIQLGRLDSTVKRLQKAQSASGASQADGVTPDQLSQLQYLRDEMRREAAVNKTMPVNSTTVQNLATNRLMAGVNGGLDAATGLGVYTLNPAAPIPFMARMAGAKLQQRGQEMVMQGLRNRLLNPQDSAAVAPP